MGHGRWTGLIILAAVAATLWMGGAAIAVKADGQGTGKPSRRTQAKPKWYEKTSPARTTVKSATTTASAKVTTGTRRYYYSKPGAGRPRPAPTATPTPQVLFYRTDEEPMAAPMMEQGPGAVPDPIELDRSGAAPSAVPDPIELDRSGKPQP